MRSWEAIERCIDGRLLRKWWARMDGWMDGWILFGIDYITQTLQEAGFVHKEMGMLVLVMVRCPSSLSALVACNGTNWFSPPLLPPVRPPSLAPTSSDVLALKHLSFNFLHILPSLADSRLGECRL